MAFLAYALDVFCVGEHCVSTCQQVKARCCWCVKHTWFDRLLGCCGVKHMGSVGGLGHLLVRLAPASTDLSVAHAWWCCAYAVSDLHTPCTSPHKHLTGSVVTHGSRDGVVAAFIRTHKFLF